MRLPVFAKRKIQVANVSASGVQSKITPDHNISHGDSATLCGRLRTTGCRARFLAIVPPLARLMADGKLWTGEAWKNCFATRPKLIWMNGILHPKWTESESIIAAEPQ